MKFLIRVIVLSFLVGCATGSATKQELLSWSDFSSLKVGADTKATVQSKLGVASESEHDAGDSVQWTYTQNGTPKLWLVFERGVLASVALSVWENDPERNLKNLLSKFAAKWKVKGELITNPHNMPTMCYLEDEAGGKSIEIHGYKKTVVDLMKWDPGLVKLQTATQSVGREHCIGGHCSKVNKSDAKWEPDHCEWLRKEIIALMQLGS